LEKVIDGDGEFWHTEAFPLIKAVGVGRTVTVVVTTAVGPPQPLAETPIVATPLNEAEKFTVALDPVPVTVLPVPVTVQL
jgi:hypothetical protein